jgi:hypothetical protein
MTCDSKINLSGYGPTFHIRKVCIHTRGAIGKPRVRPFDEGTESAEVATSDQRRRDALHTTRI